MTEVVGCHGEFEAVLGEHFVRGVQYPGIVDLQRDIIFVVDIISIYYYYY